MKRMQEVQFSQRQDLRGNWWQSRWYPRLFILWIL